jgi:hypothetical protein
MTIAWTPTLPRPHVIRQVNAQVDTRTEVSEPHTTDAPALGAAAKAAEQHGRVLTLYAAR